MVVDKLYNWKYRPELMEFVNLPLYSLIQAKRSKTFTFRGETYLYENGRYNEARCNERSFEVPVGIKWLQTHGKNSLEVGNVLSHYCRIPHLVLDKYEGGDSVINQDAVEFWAGSEHFDNIISISTLEHIGKDEPSVDPSKGPRAIENLLRQLKRGGEFLFSWTLGYNRNLDSMLESGRIHPTETHFLVRPRWNEWLESDWNKAKGKRFRGGWPFMSGSAIVVGIISKE